MKIITTTVVLVCSFVLMGCQEPSKGPDQCLRQEIFKQCMASLPKGPQSLTATGNDWDEVVNSCDSSAYRHSIRRAEAIKPECRTH